MANVMILSILLPLVTGIYVVLSKGYRGTKQKVMGVSLLVEFALCVFIAISDMAKVTLFSMTPTLKVSLCNDPLSKLFLLVASFGFLMAGIFAFKYMEHEKDGALSENAFFLFFFFSLAGLVGMDLSDNLISMYFFFEMITLFSMPMVLTEGGKACVSAALKYLFYSIAGAFLALGFIFFMSRFANSFDFVKGGNLNMAQVAGHENLLEWMVLLGVIGFGAKAGMYPLHGWLPTAHPVAPAPASAVLSGIITKAGVLAIIRVIYYVCGTEFLSGTWTIDVLQALALVTVFMGSMMAYREKVFKKRLAFSSVSQISYVLFGIFLLNPTGVTGGLMQILYHATVKICLFLCAGSIIFNTGYTRVDDFANLGKKMPVTFICFTLASLSLIGIPPFAGFVSKWYLAQGALNSDSIFCYAGPVILLISALLTAGYLLPISISAFFPGDAGKKYTKCDEGGFKMKMPLIVLSCMSLLFGIFSGYLYPLFETIVGAIL